MKEKKEKNMNIDAPLSAEDTAKKATTAELDEYAKERAALAKRQKKQVVKHHKKLIKRRKPNRSIGGDIALYIFLIFIAIAMSFPIVYAISSSLKPLDELFMFPPKIFAKYPTTDNFSDLFVTMGKSWVPFSRYLTNTLLITVVGTFGHLIIASMAAYVLAKGDIPGGNGFFKLVTLALMFTGYVTSIPNYLIINFFGMVDTHLAVIIPAFAMPIGLFMMKQYMESIPDALMEAARIDGANEWKTFMTIIFPNVKPASMTIIIFAVQALWNNGATNVIYSEEKKTLVYALNQIQGGGIARTGQAAAVTVIIMMVPILFFIFAESQILETMASSGMKD
ncbi:MAG: carbohydrate ABC transporter permease [Lachnospiraceae bacterium]|nr:carbohydrate ABC transporter permease [Lachnospiraceae bacterium]